MSRVESQIALQRMTTAIMYAIWIGVLMTNERHDDILGKRTK